MIRNPKWINDHFPAKTQRPLPSVLDDRTKLSRILRNTSMRPSERHRKLLKSLPYIRARLRDQKWLREQLDPVARERTRNEQGHIEHLRDSRAVSIEEAAQKLAKDEGRRPRRIVPAMLTGLTGLSHSQIASVIRSSPDME
jgi:hypothetical protein